MTSPLRPQLVGLCPLMMHHSRVTSRHLSATACSMTVSALDISEMRNGTCCVLWNLVLLCSSTVECIHASWHETRQVLRWLCYRVMIALPPPCFVLPLLPAPPPHS